MAILWCRLRTHTWIVAAIAAFFVLTFSGGAVMRGLRSGPVAFNRTCDAPANVCRLEKLLAQTGVHYGYATYWKGNVTTLVSEGRVKTCGVLLKPRLTPFRWLTTEDCFDRPPDDRYFFAFDRSEIANAGRESLVADAGAPDEVVTGNEFEIWIYTTAKAKLDWLERR
jgi:hypothetical protein